MHEFLLPSSVSNIDYINIKENPNDMEDYFENYDKNGCATAEEHSLNFILYTEIST